VAVGRGRFDEADRLVAETSAVLRHSPWHSGIQALLVTQVVRLHAGGDEQARAAFWKGTVRRWPAATLYEGSIGPIYLAHLALAAIWASELGEAQNVVGLLSDYAEAAPWASVSADWLSGLIAERKGDLETARVLLARAAGAELPDMPLYRAHILADHARAAGSAGRTAEEHEGRRAAHEIYRSLGAEPYLRRVRAEPGGGSGAGDYSDRERDILTLVLAGLSYAQIVKELYITRSTVGYHLSNMYAKAGARSRHELAAQARARPERFGLSTPR
jgi:DNA-binding CsgD family transcriptional regulator